MTIDNTESGKLGKGSYGFVVKADRNGQQRAVKTVELREQNTCVDFGDTRRERRVWEKLSESNNIVRLHQTFTLDGKVLKKNFLKVNFGYLARCEFCLKSG